MSDAYIGMLCGSDHYAKVPIAQLIASDGVYTCPECGETAPLDAVGMQNLVEMAKRHRQGKDADHLGDGLINTRGKPIQSTWP